MDKLPYHWRLAMILFGIDEKAYQQAVADYEKRCQQVAEEYRREVDRFARWYENELRRYGEPQ